MVTEELRAVMAESALTVANRIDRTDLHHPPASHPQHHNPDDPDFLHRSSWRLRAMPSRMSCSLAITTRTPVR